MPQRRKCIHKNIKDDGTTACADEVYGALENIKSEHSICESATGDMFIAEDDIVQLYQHDFVKPETLFLEETVIALTELDQSQNAGVPHDPETVQSFDPPHMDNLEMVYVNHEEFAVIKNALNLEDPHQSSSLLNFNIYGDQEPPIFNNSSNQELQYQASSLETPQPVEQILIKTEHTNSEYAIEEGAQYVIDEEIEEDNYFPPHFLLLGEREACKVETDTTNNFYDEVDDEAEMPPEKLHDLLHFNHKFDKCLMCKMSFKTKKSFLYHFKKKHKNTHTVTGNSIFKICKDFKNVCDKEPETEPFYNNHIGSIGHTNLSGKLLSTERFICSLCGKCFLGKQLFLTHLKTVHSNYEIAEDGEAFRVHRCSACPKWFSEKYHLEQHWRMVHPHCENEMPINLMPYKCKLCGLGFRYHDLQEQHLKEVHVCDLSCPSCERMFISNDNLKRHLKVCARLKELNLKQDCNKKS